VSWVTSLARPEIVQLKSYEHATWEIGLERLHANELPWRAAAACWCTAATCAALCADSDAHVDAAIESICDSACERAFDAPSSACLCAPSSASFRLPLSSVTWPRCWSAYE